MDTITDLLTSPEMGVFYGFGAWAAFMWLFGRWQAYRALLRGE